MPGDDACSKINLVSMLLQQVIITIIMEIYTAPYQKCKQPEVHTKVIQTITTSQTHTHKSRSNKLSKYIHQKAENQTLRASLPPPHPPTPPRLSFRSMVTYSGPVQGLLKIKRLLLNIPVLSPSPFIPTCVCHIKHDAHFKLYSPFPCIPATETGDI